MLVIGCNYHLTWQSNKAMRFVLTELKGNQAKVKTRTTKKEFWCNKEDLIFIQTYHNRVKARKIMEQTEVTQ